MSNEEEQYEESAMGGPGAPTPVSALEVCLCCVHIFMQSKELMKFRASTVSLHEISSLWLKGVLTPWNPLPIRESRDSGLVE